MGWGSGYLSKPIVVHPVRDQRSYGVQSHRRRIPLEIVQSLMGFTVEQLYTILHITFKVTMTSETLKALGFFMLSKEKQETTLWERKFL